MAKHKSDEDLSELFETKLAITSDHPFLVDANTIDFVKKSKILFINRGLPGSGKTTLSNRIKTLYGESTVICAGDDFFTDSDGNYKFDKDKLNDAHASAQQKARDACRDGKSPVIADNTNVRFWEFKPYLEIAREFHYIVLVIEPRTPHKFDVDKLALLNKHNVPREKIKQRLKEFQTVYPFYYGWYLNENDSLRLTKVSKQCFKYCVENCAGLREDFLRLKSTIDENLIYEYKNEIHLHCTSKFLGRNLDKESSLKEYVTNPMVTDSLGKAFKLEITGFSITKRTIAAEITLKQEEIGSLWGNDLNAHERLEVIEGFDLIDSNNNNVLDQLEYGARAHITIGLQPNEKAYKAGIDLIRMKLLVKSNKEKTYEKIETDKFEIHYFKNSLCYCKLKNSLKINTLFTGEY